MFKKLILIYLSRLSEDEIQEVAFRCLSHLWSKGRLDLLNDILECVDDET